MEDDHSRAICGYTVFTGAPSALNTALALRQAIWCKTDPTWAMCGIPDILHVDHGSDFTSHHLERTAVELHIRIIHSIVGRPQGRGKIERLTVWMHARLTLAVWPMPSSLPISDLEAVEVDAIRAWTPPLNIRDNPAHLRRLRMARAAMAAEAKAWVPGGAE